MNKQEVISKFHHHMDEDADNPSQKVDRQHIASHLDKHLKDDKHYEYHHDDTKSTFNPTSKTLKKTWESKSGTGEIHHNGNDIHFTWASGHGGAAWDSIKEKSTIKESVVELYCRQISEDVREKK